MKKIKEHKRKVGSMFPVYEKDRMKVELYKIAKKFGDNYSYKKIVDELEAIIKKAKEEAHREMEKVGKEAMSHLEVIGMNHNELSLKLIKVSELKRQLKEKDEEIKRLKKKASDRIGAIQIELGKREDEVDYWKKKYMDKYWKNL